MRRILFLAGLCALFSGCAQLARVTPQPDVPQPAKALTAYRDAHTATTAFASDTSTAERDTAIWTAINDVDVNYLAFRNQFWFNRSAFDTTTDLVALGLTSAAAVTGGAALKSVLAAVATGVLGAHSTIDKDLYAEQSRFLIVLTMDRLRAEQRARIVDRLRLSVDRYPLAQGMNDVQAYAQAGTVISALVALSQSVAAPPR